MKHASLKDTIHIRMANFPGCCGTARLWRLSLFQANDGHLLDDQSGAATTKKGVRKPSDQRGFRR